MELEVVFNRANADTIGIVDRARDTMPVWTNFQRLYCGESLTL
jgi:hypothetical protein